MKGEILKGVTVWFKTRKGKETPFWKNATIFLYPKGDEGVLSSGLPVKFDKEKGRWIYEVK